MHDVNIGDNFTHVHEIEDVNLTTRLQERHFTRLQCLLIFFLGDFLDSQES